MNLVYVLVVDAVRGIYTTTDVKPYKARVCPETGTWNYAKSVVGDRDDRLYCDNLPLGKFITWTASLERHMVVGVFDQNNVLHVEEFGNFTFMVKAWRERGGVERRSPNVAARPS